ncbi:MAG: Gfo/Idh/MocA family oxidoreductase, partial [Deltaproteobacteria bacterium]|nr:Gfo/Idh/MocA family oxidoreductase [Deltaproteobacteria bacterium]
MAAKLKVLLCGTGENARWHLAESRRTKAARISHVHGLDRARTEDFARRFGLQPVDDLEGFLASGQVQGVDVCTVHDRHAPLALAALAAGLPVLVEKPLATDLAAARKLVEEAEVRGVPLGVLYHKRYAPQHAGLKKFIDSGGFGPGPIEAEMSIHHAADSRYFGYGESWKASLEKNGGGILMNQVVHYLDLLTWWLGPAAEVESQFVVGQSSMEGESTADLLIKFQAGHRARFSATVAVRKSLPVYWAAHGTRGSLVFHGMDLIRNTVGFEAHEAFRMRLFADRLIGRAPYRIRRKLGLPLSRLDDESAGTGWEEFFSRVAKGQPPLVDGREGLQVLEVIRAAYGPDKPRARPRPGMIPPAFGVPAKDYYLGLAQDEKKLDVVLVNPLMVSEYNLAHAHIQTHRPRPPLGLASATAFLRRAGFRARLIDAAVLGLGVEDTAQIIKTFNPRMLVLTTAQLDRWQNPDLDISAAAGLIKEAGIRPTVVVGPHGSATPAWTLNQTKADYLVKGEPEQTLTELVGYVLHGGSLEAVPGLAWLEDGLLRESLPRLFDDDLDEYPIPAYEDLPLDRYQYTDQALAGPYCSMLSARGCPAHCLFCLKAMMPAKWRAQSAERVVEEMALLNSKYGVRSVYFQDWEFLHDKDRALKLAQLIQDRGLEMRWGFSTRLIYLTDPGLVRALARGGCVLINSGYETGAQELLNKVKKGVTLKAARQAVDNCRRAGVELRLFGLVNLPGEKLRTIRQSMKFLTQTKSE